MMKAISLKDGIGKTVAGYALSGISGQAVITFTDDTFATLAIQRAYEPCDDTIEEEQLELFSFEAARLVDLGIFTADKLQATKDAETAAATKSRDEADLERYLRLKEKFDTK